MSLYKYICTEFIFSYVEIFISFLLTFSTPPKQHLAK